MPYFKYRAVNEAGAEVTNVMEAAAEEMVAEQLERLGYLPVAIKAQKKPGTGFAFSGKKKLKMKELIVFTRQLVTLLKAGVPLLSALDALGEQAESDHLKELIRKVYVGIENGISFSDALAQHPEAFPDLYVNSVRAGETGGKLDVVLERLAQLLEHDHETKSQVKSAMRYPVIVVCSLIVAFVTLMLVVVPNFIDLFSKMNVELPLPTRILIGMHTIIADYWHISLVIIGGLAIGFLRYVKTEKGAYQWDKFRMQLPIMGELYIKSAMSRFSRMFETLNTSGLPILQTLEITAKTVGSVVIGKELERVSYGILQGEGLAGTLQNGKVFPPMITRMIAIGEQSGSLDEMLRSVSQHYDSEVEHAVRNLTSMIEPVLTVAMGVMVLFLALAIFLPMWELTSLVQ